MSLRLTFLGTGTSVGVPQIGCTCPTCTSTDPRDRRRRAGLYVQSPETAFVVDTSPEFRLACLELNITRVEACLLTHVHMDHVAGFDDLRRFNTLNGKTILPCYASRETIESMHHIFPYIGKKPKEKGLYRPMIDFRPVKQAFQFHDVRITPLPVIHGHTPTNGYLFEHGGRSVAYICDCYEIPPKTLAKIRGVDVMVLDCLRDTRPHSTHLTLDGALAYMKEIAPRRGYFIHMCHDVKHAQFEAKLPRWIRLTYDGLEIKV